jgi:VWFA-related protein
MGRFAKAVIALSLAPLLSIGAGAGVAVRQLEGILAAAYSAGTSDEATAAKIARLDLNERLTGATLLRLSSGVGIRTAEALELQADRSAFLDPPADEIPPGERPSAAEQRAIAERAAAYTVAYVKELPNLVCTRTVHRFDDLDTRGRGQLRLHDMLIGELTVRDGAESFRIQNAGLITAQADWTGSFEQMPNRMTTSGEFGSILAEPFAARTTFAWRRWETLNGKRVAVFGYSVPQTASRFTLFWYGTRHNQGTRVSQQAAYEGELSIEPASGAILRVTQQAVDLPGSFPVKQARTAVEYGPVLLAGDSFLFPARSVSWMFALSRETKDIQRYVNRSEFRNYHKFAAESTLAFDAAAETPPTSVAATPAASEPVPVPMAEPPAAEASVTLPEPPPVPAAPSVTPPANAFPPQAAPSPIAEQTPPDSQPVFRVRRSEIPVRVVVRDERGNAVGGLRREDFELFDNGKRQQISGFRIESRSLELAPRGTSAGSAPQLPPTPPPDRYIVFVINDLRLTFGDLAMTRAAAKRAISDAVQLGTRVAILTETGIQCLGFTGDLAKLDALLDRITPQAVNDSVAREALRAVKSGMPRMNGPANPVIETTPGTAEIEAEAIAFGHSGDSRRTRSPIEGIEAAVHRLEVMPGDRSIVFVSPGFDFPVWASRAYWALIDRAARKGIPINTLDARGVWTLPEFDVERTMPNDPYHQSAKNPHEGDLKAGAYLGAFADGTGGIAVVNNDFYGGLKRMAMPPEFVYMLTFSPPDLVPDGKYHDLKVEIPNRPGVTVQARNGYLAPDRKLTEAEQAAREIEDAIFSRDEMREIPLSVRVDQSTASAKLSTTTHIGLGAIRFDSKDGHSRASLTATVGLFDANGIYIDGKQQTFELDYPDGKVPAGLDARSEFNAAPGTYLVRVVVRDADGHISATNQTAEVR